MDPLDKHINELTKEDWEDLYCNRGLTLTQLAEHFKLSRKTITKRLEQFGVDRRGFGPAKKIFLPENELRRLYVEEKWTAVRLAKHFGCSDKSVRDELSSLDILRVHRPGKTFTKEFLEENLKSSSVKELAERLDVSTVTLYKAMHRAGIEVKSNNSVPPDEDVVNAIIILYNNGMSTPMIARIVCEDVSHVTGILGRAGVVMRERNDYTRKLPPDEKVLALYNSGLSTSEIARQFGASKSAAQQSLERADVVWRSKSETRRGELNPMHGQHHTLETRSRMSDAYASQTRDLPEHGRGTPTPLDTPHQGTVITRSTWEAAVGRYLNRQGVDYWYEPDTLQLSRDGARLTYKPDFKLKDDYYIEVKGYYSDEDRIKVETARAAGHVVELWGIEKLQNFNILDDSLRVI